MATADEFLRLSRPQLDAIKAAAPDHYKVLFDAIDHERLAITFLRPGMRIRSARSIMDGRRSLVIVGDDAEGGSKGPEAFDQKTLKRIVKRAVGGMVHSAAGDPRHYAVMVATALLMPGMPAVLVETTPRHHADWKNWLERHAPAFPTIHVVPPDAGHA